MGIFGDGLYSPRTVGSFWVMNYALNHVLMYRRPDMAVEIGFKKWNKCWMSGLPTNSPHALFLGLLKIVPGCVNWTKIVHMLCA